MGRRGQKIASRILDGAEAEGRFAFAIERFEARSLQRACAAGEAVEVSRGYFARVRYHDGLPRRARAMHLIRAVARKHPSWVFASFSAALVYGLQVSNGLTDVVHLAMSECENRSVGDGRFHCHLVRDASFVTVAGIRVTPLKTTLLDCLCQANFSQGLAIADSALHWRLVDADGLREHVERSGFRRKGIRTARRVLRWMDGGSDNGGESMARAVMIELGFQLPELQVEVADPLTPGGMWRVDFCWRLPDGRVVIGELDGGGKYLADGEGAAEALDHMRRERLRESRLNLTGAMVIRFSFEQAMDRAYMERLLANAGVPRRVDACL